MFSGSCRPLLTRDKSYCYFLFSYLSPLFCKYPCITACNKIGTSRGAAFVHSRTCSSPLLMSAYLHERRRFKNIPRMTFAVALFMMLLPIHSTSPSVFAICSPLLHRNAFMSDLTH